MAFLLVTLCCLLATLGSFLFGYDSGVIGSTLEQDAFQQYFRHPSDAATGGIVSSYNGGAILGSLVVPYIGDPFGRRPVMFIGALLAAIGGALQAGAVNVAMLIVGRLIAGFAIGLMSATIPIYCSEVSPTRIRGFLGAMQQWMLGLGIVVAQWVGYGCSLHTGPFTWRFPLALQAAPAVILGAGVWFLPESPRWLIEKGHRDAGRAVLNRLHLDRARSNTDLVDAEFTQICESLAASSDSVAGSSWRGLLFSSAPTWRRRVLLACGMQAFTQCSGTNVIQVYSPRIYRSLGLPTSTTLMITAVWGALALLWNTIFMLFIDRVGRRKLLIPSLLGMGVVLCIQATLARYYNNFTPPPSPSPSPSSSSSTATPAPALPSPHALRAAIAMFFVFSIFFTSLGLISWVYPTEIFPTAVRARGSALATATNWSLNLVFAQCSPIALTALQYRYFYCFVGFNWAAAGIVWAFYPETKGRSLEEVGEAFLSDVRSQTKPQVKTQTQMQALRGRSGAENGELKSGVTWHVARHE